LNGATEGCQDLGVPNFTSGYISKKMAEFNAHSYRSIQESIERPSWDQDQTPFNVLKDDASDNNIGKFLLKAPCRNRSYYN
jgi:hypothetical protein